MEAALLIAFQGSLILVLAFGSQHLNFHQPRPYMDEIFHIPQAQKYCNGSFDEWDPMITTLPGLYLFSVGILRPLSYFLSLPVIDVCSVAILRITNAVFAVANIYLLYEISRILNRNKQEQYSALKAATLSLMPLLFFFNFLYYTDPGSLFFTLYAYYFHLRGSYPLSSILGIVALLFRQTNIIWLFFMTLCNVVKNIHKQAKLEQGTNKTLLSVTTKSVPIFIINTVISCWSYAVVGLVSIAFVFYNGSIVVGDKSAHTACFNPSQLGFFATFTLALASPHLISNTKILSFLKDLLNHKLLFVIGTCVFLALIHTYFHEHPYLLADNRHYTFYVWSKFFKRYEWFCYAITPVYVYALWSVDNSLSHMHWMLRVSLWFCIVVATVPQKLMEFRYFVIPYTIVRLHMNNESTKSLLFEMLLYISINMATFYIFFYKPIFWPNILEPQRIMW